MISAFMHGYRGMAGPMAGRMGGLAKLAGGYAAAAPGVAKSFLSSQWGTTLGRGTLTGAAAGAAWGLASDDTSIVGGALIGAGLGRYGTAGWMAGETYKAGLRFVPPSAGDHLKAIGRGAYDLGYAEVIKGYQGARMAANKGITSFKAMFK